MMLSRHTSQPSDRTVKQHSTTPPHILPLRDDDTAVHHHWSTHYARRLKQSYGTMIRVSGKTVRRCLTSTRVRLTVLISSVLLYCIHIYVGGLTFSSTLIPVTNRPVDSSTLSDDDLFSMSVEAYNRYAMEQYDSSTYVSRTQAMELSELFMSHDLYVVWEIPYSHCVGFVAEMILLVVGLYRYIPDRIGIIAGGEHAWCKGLSQSTVDALETMSAAPIHTWAPNIIHIYHTVPVLYEPFPRTGFICHDGKCNKYSNEISGVGYRVGRSMIETARIPHAWTNILQMRTDEIWVPANSIIDCFTNGGISSHQVHVLTEPIDDDLYGETFNAMATVPQPLPIAGKAPYSFFMSGKLEDRKGWNILLQAFLYEFTPDDQVDLWLHTYFTGHTRTAGARHERDTEAVREYVWSMSEKYVAQQADKVHEASWTPPLIRQYVHVIVGEVDARVMPRLYASMSAFVLPTHGEGWGLPIADAMTAGLPVIATNWSGQTHFMNQLNSFPLPIEDQLVAAPFPFDPTVDRWAEPRGSVLQALMREVYTNRALSVARGRRARIDMLTKYSVDSVAVEALGLLVNITERVEQSSIICALQSDSILQQNGEATCCFRAVSVVPKSSAIDIEQASDTVDITVRHAAHDGGCYDGGTYTLGYCQCDNTKGINVVRSRESRQPCSSVCADQPRLLSHIVRGVSMHDGDRIVWMTAAAPSTHTSDGWVRVWSTNVQPNAETFFKVQDDGNLVLYRVSDNKDLWSSGIMRPVSSEHVITGQIREFRDMKSGKMRVAFDVHRTHRTNTTEPGEMLFTTEHQQQLASQPVQCAQQSIAKLDDAGDFTLFIRLCSDHET